MTALVDGPVIQDDVVAARAPWSAIVEDRKSVV